MVGAPLTALLPPVQESSDLRELLQMSEVRSWAGRQATRRPPPSHASASCIRRGRCGHGARPAAAAIRVQADVAAIPFLAQIQKQKCKAEFERLQQQQLKAAQQEQVALKVGMPAPSCLLVISSYPLNEI